MTVTATCVTVTGTFSCSVRAKVKSERTVSVPCLLPCLLSEILPVCVKPFPPASLKSTQVHAESRPRSPSRDAQSIPGLCVHVIPRGLENPPLCAENISQSTDCPKRPCGGPSVSKQCQATARLGQGSVRGCARDRDPDASTGHARTQEAVSSPVQPHRGQSALSGPPQISGWLNNSTGTRLLTDVWPPPILYLSHRSTSRLPLRQATVTGNPQQEGVPGCHGAFSPCPLGKQNIRWKYIHTHTHPVDRPRNPAVTGQCAPGQSESTHCLASKVTASKQQVTPKKKAVPPSPWKSKCFAIPRSSEKQLWKQRRQSRELFSRRQPPGRGGERPAPAGPPRRPPAKRGAAEASGGRKTWAHVGVRVLKRTDPTQSRVCDAGVGGRAPSTPRAPVSPPAPRDPDGPLCPGLRAAGVWHALGQPARTFPDLSTPGSHPRRDMWVPRTPRGWRHPEHRRGLSCTLVSAHEMVTLPRESLKTKPVNTGPWHRPAL